MPEQPDRQDAAPAETAAPAEGAGAAGDDAIEALADAAMARLDLDEGASLAGDERADVRRRVERLLRAAGALRRAPLANGEAPAWQFVPPPAVGREGTLGRGALVAAEPSGASAPPGGAAVASAGAFGGASAGAPSAALASGGGSAGRSAGLGTGVPGGDATLPPSAAPGGRPGADVATERGRRLAFASVAELGRLLRAGETDPVELVELALERLERLGPRLNALVTPLGERALREAQRATEELRAGRDRGPLHGIPYGAKDLLATGDGSPTTWGAAPFREQRLAEDAALLRRLEAAGAVLVAKLAMVELAGGFGYDQPDAAFTGPGRNPWDPQRWSGGSSSGSGSAVGAGLVPWAVGSETWGSITTPSAYCGLSGLRPTFGRVPTRGAMALCWSLDKLGPMCRSALDCGLALEGMAGPDPADPEDPTPPWRFDPEGWRRGPFRLAMARGLPDEAGVQQAVRERFAAALAELRDLASVEEVDLPAFPYAEAMQVILNAEAAGAFQEFLETDGPARLTAPEDHAGGYAGTTVRAVDYLRALRLRRQVAAAWARLLAPYDALITPTLAGVAPPIDQHFSAGGGRGSAPLRDVGAAGNLVGLPALTVPMGRDERGLPAGLAFVGRAHAEQAILDIGMAFQRRTGWHLERPEW